jgi:hypothetical protein
MAAAPTFKELFRDCQRSAVHLETRDAYSKTDSAFVDWKAGESIPNLAWVSPASAGERNTSLARRREAPEVSAPPC